MWREEIQLFTNYHNIFYLINCAISTLQLTVVLGECFFSIMKTFTHTHIYQSFKNNWKSSLKEAVRILKS